MLLIQKIPQRERGSGVRRTGAAWRRGVWLGIVLASASGCTPPGPSATAVEDDPAPAVDDDWEQFSDPARGIAFSYPRDLGTEYIRTVDWPPQVLVEDGPFTCVEAGVEIARAGRTEPRTIGGRDYCVTRVVEGAAGSIYTQYAYATPAEGSVMVLTFTLRAVQCGNYDEPRRNECVRERAAFSMDPVVDAIARSFTVSDLEP